MTVFTARLPTAMATMLLPPMLTLAAPVLFKPEPLMATLLTVAVTEAKLYWTLVMAVLAVFRPGVNALTWIALLAELP